MKLAFVIPCYNSARTLPAVVKEIKDVMKKLRYAYEIILVNDGSSDGTYEVIRSLRIRDKRIRGVFLSKNFGQHSAQMAGYSLVTADIIVNVDDDGQAPVRDLGKLLKKLDEGYDAVFARYVNIKQGLFRRFGTWINHAMISFFTEKPKGLTESNFYIMRRYVMDEIVKYKNAYPYISGLIFRTTHNLANADMEYRERISGKSTYTFTKMVSLWFNGLTAFSVKPLRIALIIGGLSAVSGFFYGTFIIIRRITDPEYVLTGWSSVMAVKLFMGGMIMILLGLIGEYVGRIYLNLNRNPQYVIRKEPDAGIKPAKPGKKRG